MNEVPTFAVVGAVNHGKSSVVSTLAENDKVRISDIPGETVESRRFWLLDLFAFYDTPGFQNPRAALRELETAANAPEPLRIFREFMTRHAGDPKFEAECTLFAPIVEGAGVVYVVDGSQPVLELHKAEMEILRLTAQPRLAIINRTGSDDHVAEWKRRLGQHFNAIREFNAHHARFEDRLELLETLAGIDQAWKPKLARAVVILSEERRRRIEEAAEIIAEMLIACLTYRQSAATTSDLPARRAAQAAELKTAFMAAVSARELRAHRRIIELFGHNLVRPPTEGAQLFDQELFSDETWRAFGLDEKQLVAAGTVAGAAAGAAIDVMTVGHTLLAGSAVGGAVGAAGAWFLGRKRPELKVHLPWRNPLLPKLLSVGGRELVVGPYEALNFPWVLLDRALATAFYVMNRAHARRDVAVIDTVALVRDMESQSLVSSRWDAEQRGRAERIFTAIRRGKCTPEQRNDLRVLLADRLGEVAKAPAVTRD